MEVIMKNKWLLCILLMLFLPFGLFAQVAPPLEEQKTEAQEAPENNKEVTTNSDTTTDGDAGKTIKGVINDEQGETIIGASVIIKGEDTGTTSDMDGRFTLEAPEGAILVISYIGYHTQEVKVRKRSLLRVVLKEDNQLLDEVVVVGYGTVKKSDLTGAVSGVSNRQYKNQPVQRVENILQGRTPGVEVTATSGMPGASMKVRVRGTTSINKSSDPLYVIDGIISSSGLDGINPSDIQSMEILKDASSTAIYGSRGSNGVILITTKQGSEGKAQVTFDASVGLSTVRKQYDLLNAYEYATALNDIRGSSTISAEDLEAYKNGTKGINWTDLLTRTGITQDYRLAISGGNEKVKYLISGNVLDQEAITIMSDYKRYGIRANIDSEVKPWLTISAKLNASSLHKHNEGGANWLHVTNFSPTMELKDPETGVYNTDPYNMVGSNPYGEIVVNDSDSYSYNLNANLTLLFKIMKGLTLSVQGGYDYDNSPSYSFRSKLDSPGAINSASNTSALHNYWQNTNNLTWQKQFGDHSFTAMAVWEISRSWDSQLKGTGSNLNNESVGYWNLGNAAIRDASNSYTEFSLASGIVRANYDYKKRYFITAALRADGSSKFQGDNKWGYFPSAAIAWDIAQESFMSNQHVLDQLKLRASFGVTGNQDIAAYSTLGMLSGASYGWGTSTSSTGYWGNQFATPDITWEKTYQYDLGLDLSLGGFNITVDWFKKQTKDLLFQKQVPKYNGGGTYWVNQGKLNNTGVEMSLTTFPVKGAVTWETSLNASYVKNEVADLAGDDFVLTANYSDLGGPLQIMKPGYPMGSFYVYQWKGFDDKGANLYQKADGSLTTNPTSDDLVVKGQASPKWTVGWNNTVTWKNWTLNVFFNAATGYDRLNISRFMAASMTGVSRFITLRDAYFKGWDHVANKADALYPSLTNTDNKSYANSDFWLEDASFIKLKNISLSYRIPRRVLKFASVQLSVSAQDLFTITRYKGMDPEVYTSYDGLDYGAYPIPRTITFGAKIRF
ncbi:tonB-linked outer membrane, SusC/RagA family protein [Bacteroides ovatus str. 3725 D9 iii]|jgi:TonB-linked SusC/RagA family outer membrane protein|uniref:TonB-dependent receptor n=2 Tax=Bacteroides ovatus TaxID=28116 RepID=A0AAP9DMS9_BACOV|nr:tonB-linked outer membrane, SusC/RagA family protein [Bacteroides ovatus str. 3725 D9 iii]MCE8875487.1 TonB-dependent receptor [Bacteroides ovatus]OFO91997.1 SusC/RagA family protein [Bacteroides sp. HMSC073E02]RJU34379.1 TonB-dependent receptor [Bacteroides sp. CF01-10NS]MCE8891539.1 TonB-dependent receptor [Bacteroides ovatus]